MLCKESKKELSFFSFFCCSLESGSPRHRNPRATSIKVNLPPGLGALMSALIRKKCREAQSGDT